LLSARPVAGDSPGDGRQQNASTFSDDQNSTHENAMRKDVLAVVLSSFALLGVSVKHAAAGA
jgi:hypothetical protein